MNNDSNNNAAPAPAADATFPAAWQPALDHSAYLRQLLSCRGELVPILAESWQRPLTAADLEDCVTAVEGIKNNGAVSGATVL